MPVTKPPRPTATSAPFWRALGEGRLILQRCDDCRRLLSIPRPACHHCMSPRLTWEELSGIGSVHSFTIVRRTPNKGFKELVPYVYAIVELDEGPRLTTNIVDCPVDTVRVGQRVEAVFDDAGDGLGLVRFRPPGG